MYQNYSAYWSTLCIKLRRKYGIILDLDSIFYYKSSPHTRYILHTHETVNKQVNKIDKRYYYWIKVCPILKRMLTDYKNNMYTCL